MNFLELRKEMAKRYPEQSFKNRMTGKSTALALRVISDAMLSPDSYVKCRDHRGTRYTDILLFDMVHRLLELLRLECFIFNKTSLSIKYSLKKREGRC